MKNTIEYVEPTPPSHVMDMVGKEVMCNRSAKTYGGEEVYRDKVYEVESAEMYLRSVPVIKLKGLKGVWSYCKFSVV